MLSSLTIILPSMTTFLNLFAALNGYYLFLFILYRNVFVLFLPFCELLFMLFFRLYVFFVIALDQFYSLFVVSFFVVCVCKSFPFFPHMIIQNTHLHI